MTGSEWEQTRIRAVNFLAKTMSEQVDRAFALASSDVEGIAKALANVETCERIIGALCDWSGGDDTEVGIGGGGATENEEEDED